MTDYDSTDIPAAYDRARDHGPEVLEVWMRALETHLEGRSVTRILDLGCGTGRFSEGLASRFEAEVIALDPSEKMLAQARAKQRDARVQYHRGRAEAIPLASLSVDVVFISMSFHHFTDPTAAAHECFRVLRNQGRVFVRTGTREQIDSYPYVPFFSSTPSLLEKVLPNHNDICQVFAAAGFQKVAWEIITQTIAPNWMAYADKIAAGGDSVLARLSKEDFETGVGRLRHHAAVASGPVIEPIDLFVFRRT